MCVCVFPDCSGVTVKDLLYLGNLRSLETLILHKMNVSFFGQFLLNVNVQVAEQDPVVRIRDLSQSLIKLLNTGELVAHTRR